MIPVHIVAGYLGVGKTTALTHLLESVPGRVGVVVNDFGTTGFDGERLGTRALVVTIDGGCLCCTAPKGFVAAVGQLIDAGVDAIFVEPTGIAQPEDLVDSLRRAPIASRLALGPVVGLVDPMRLSDHEVAQRAAGADVVVANRWSDATPAARDAFDAWVAALAPPPMAVARVDFGRIAVGLLDWPDGEGPRVRTTPVGHGHHGVVSLRWPPEVRFRRSAVLAALGHGSGLARAKGWLVTDEGVRVVERVGDKVTDAPSTWRRDSRIDLIFRGPVPVDVAALFDGLLAPAEAPSGLQVVVRGVGDTWTPAALVARADVPDVSVYVPGRNGCAIAVGPWFAELGVAPDDDVVVVAADGFVSSAVSVAALGEAWLVVADPSGGPLPASQGGPLRWLAPASGSSCSNVKQVARVVVRPSERT